jgi:hypothetical protein
MLKKNAHLVPRVLHGDLLLVVQILNNLCVPIGMSGLQRRLMFRLQKRLMYGLYRRLVYGLESGWVHGLESG